MKPGGVRVTLSDIVAVCVLLLAAVWAIPRAAAPLESWIEAGYVDPPVYRDMVSVVATNPFAQPSPPLRYALPAIAYAVTGSQAVADSVIVAQAGVASFFLFPVALYLLTRYTLGRDWAAGGLVVWLMVRLARWDNPTFHSGEWQYSLAAPLVLGVLLLAEYIVHTPGLDNRRVGSALGASGAVIAWIQLWYAALVAAAVGGTLVVRHRSWATDLLGWSAGVGGVLSLPLLLLDNSVGHSVSYLSTQLIQPGPLVQTQGITPPLIVAVGAGAVLSWEWNWTPTRVFVLAGCLLAVVAKLTFVHYFMWTLSELITPLGVIYGGYAAVWLLQVDGDSGTATSGQGQQPPS